MTSRDRRGPRRWIPLLATMLASVVPIARASESHPHSSFTVADFERVGVELATATAGTVDGGIELPAEIRANADRLAHLAPRFPGVAREVHVHAGDHVAGGALLAVVESDRLTRFEMTAPFAGVVVDRHVTVGETMSPDRSAFIVADLSTVWVDITVYQPVVRAIRAGTLVHVSTSPGGPTADAAVSWVSPVVDAGTRAATARLVVPNPDGVWRPGMFATAFVVRAAWADVVVPRTAVHRMDDHDVVFVVEADRFVPRPVQLGEPGRTHVAVLDGLAAGERYATTRSFRIKAELGKHLAEHDH